MCCFGGGNGSCVCLFVCSVPQYDFVILGICSSPFHAAEGSRWN